MNDWIKNLKIGDEVITIERNGLLPNGFYGWKSIVVKIETNYIETEYTRDRNLDWLNELVKKLSPIHRTFIKQTCKNYFAPDGTINIEKI